MRLVQAFERVLLRDGVQNVGINAVAEAARVDKVLIYRYFGDLAGLAQRWATVSEFWPGELELIGNDPAAFEKLNVHDRVCTVLVNYVDAIRRRPRTVQVLIAGLLHPSDITRALEQAFAKQGKGVGVYIKPDLGNRALMDRIWRLIVLVRSVTYYWCVREVGNPMFNDIDLRKEEPWVFLRETIAGIARCYLAEVDAAARS